MLGKKMFAINFQILFVFGFLQYYLIVLRNILAFPLWSQEIWKTLQMLE